MPEETPKKRHRIPKFEYECPICNKRLRNKRAVASHLRLATHGYDKPSGTIDTESKKIPTFASVDSTFKQLHESTEDGQPSGEDGGDVTTTAEPPQGKINTALFFIWDLLDRSQIKFLLLKDTAKEVRQTQGALTPDLHVKVIELGILEKYLTEWNQPMLKGLFKLYKVEPEWTESYIRFDYQGVTVFIRIIQKYYSFFQNPSPAFYRTFNFEIPNPWEGYWYQRHVIK